PMSDNSIAQNGPGPMPANSTTRIPSSGPIALPRSAPESFCHCERSEAISMRSRMAPPRLRVRGTMRRVVEGTLALAPIEGAQKRRDRVRGGAVERGRMARRIEPEQMAQMHLAAHERAELLGREPHIVDLQRPGFDGAAQKFLDLRPVALGPGLPEHVA